MTYDELVTAQRAHYASLAAQARQQLTDLGADAIDAETAMRDLQAKLDADLQRFEREARAFFDRGGRFDESLH